MSGDYVCIMCGETATHLPAPQQECFAAIAQYAHARAQTCHARSGQPSVLGFSSLASCPKTSFRWAHACGHFEVGTEAVRLFASRAVFGPTRNLDASLGEVRRLDDLGYRDTGAGSVWTWGEGAPDLQHKQCADPACLTSCQEKPHSFHPGVQARTKWTATRSALAAPSEASSMYDV